MMDFKKNPRTDFKDVAKLTKAQARQEIDALREGIEYHDYLYYVKDQPAISDETYDKLFRRLQELEQAFPEFASADSPTNRVAGQPPHGSKKSVTRPMLSLNAVYKEKEVRISFAWSGGRRDPNAIATPPSRSSTGFLSRLFMIREPLSAGRPEVMGKRARTSRRTSK
jgi:hypothetical protein